MACTPKPLTDEHRKVLQTLSGTTEPVGAKDIALTLDMDSKAVTSLIKTLKTKGLIESPVRCKYAITDEGKGQI